MRVLVNLPNRVQICLLTKPSFGELRQIAVNILAVEFVQVNDEYMRTLEILSKKLKFVEVDPMVKASKALKDVQPELEKVRQKAVSKVID